MLASVVLRWSGATAATFLICCESLLGQAACGPPKGSLSRLNEVALNNWVSPNRLEAALTLDSIRVERVCSPMSVGCVGIQVTVHKNGGPIGMARKDTIPVASFARLNWLAELLDIRSSGPGYGIAGDHTTVTTLTLGWVGCDSQTITEYGIESAPYAVWALEVALEKVANLPAARHEANGVR